MRILIKVHTNDIDIYLNLDKITFVENVAENVYKVFYLQNDKFTYITVNELEFKKITKFFEVIWCILQAKKLNYMFYLN